MLMTVNWKNVALLAVTISALPIFSGCCRSVDSAVSHPNQIRGWQEFGHGPTKSVGEFVVKKGEAIDNHNVAIEVLGITQGRSCFGTESTGPSARLRFSKVADRQTILEIDLTAGNTRLISFNRSLVEEYGLDTISIRGINTKEGWVWFELRP